jgi:hypothetical protein
MRRCSDQDYVDGLRTFHRFRRWIAVVLLLLGGTLVFLSFWLFVTAVLPGYSLADRQDQIEAQYPPPEAISNWSHHATFFVGTMAGGVFVLGIVAGIGSLVYSLYLFIGSRAEKLLVSSWDRILRTGSEP